VLVYVKVKGLDIPPFDVMVYFILPPFMLLYVIGDILTYTPSPIKF